MKREKLFLGVLSLTLFIAPILSIASPFLLPQPVEDVTAPPNDTVGLITLGGGNGSGFIIKSPRVVVTAAHLFFDDFGKRIPDDARWHRGYNGEGFPRAASGTVLRRVAVYTGSAGYAQMVVRHGASSPRAFEQDIAVAGSYEDLTRGRVGAWYDDPFPALDSSRPKRVVGYPSSLYQGVIYPANSPDRFKMHSSQVSHFRFEPEGPFTPNFLIVNAETPEETALLAAPGNSGGPLFVQDNGGEWRAVAILVGVRTDFFIGPPDFGGRSAVRVLNRNDFDQLINPSILAAGGSLEPPSLIQQPEDKAVHAGATVTFTVGATGATPVFYQWKKDGVLLQGETTDSLTLVNVQEAMAGRYSVVVSNAVGSVSSRAAMLDVSGTIPVSDVLQTEHVSWSSGGALPWFGQETVAREAGSSSGQAGSIRDNQQSWIEASVSGPGVLTFWWKVSSEKTFDTFSVSVGDSLRASISGEAGWEFKRLVVPAGMRKVRWVYQKDGDFSKGADTAWLDDVRFIPALDLAAMQPRVRQHYQNMLGRNPGQEPLLLWSQAINEDSAAEADLVESLLVSDEVQSKIAPLVRLYLAYFLRVPDGEGLAYWKATFAGGAALGDISNAFAGSEEFFDRYGDTSDRDFVTLVYQNVLEREPEAEGLAYWSGLLRQGRLSRGEVMTGFSESEEFRTLTLSEVHVITAFSGILLRAPEPEEFFLWLGRLDEGLPLRDLVTHLLVESGGG